MRLLLILALWMVLPITAAAQETPPLCASGAETVVARYDWQSARLTLVDWDSGATLRDFETSFPVDALYVVAWSPDCDYVLAEVTASQTTSLYVWNAATGQRVGSLAGTAYALRTLWSDDGAYLLIQIEAGGYLWNMQTNVQTLLTPIAEQYYKRSFIRAEFDTARNELLVVEARSNTGVTAYNLSTGQRIGFYDIADRRGPVTYRRMDGNRYILVYSDGRETMSNHWYSEGVALWDRDTGANIQLDPNNNAEFAPTSNYRFDFRGDLSSRYFIVADYGKGSGQLYIWDFQNLRGTPPYLPNYQQEIYRAGDMHFIDPNTFEIVDWTDQDRVDQLRIRSTVINLETYSIVHQTGNNPFDAMCSTPPDDLIWACARAAEYSPLHDDTDTGINNSTHFSPRW